MNYFYLFIIIFTLRNLADLIFFAHKKSDLVKQRHWIILYTALYYISGTAVAWSLYTEKAANIKLFSINIVLFILLYILRVVIVKTKMKKSFCVSYQPVENGELVTDGVYSIVRHPLYFIYELEMAALLLIKFNYLSLIIMFIDVFITLQKIKKEEQVLKEKYKNAYHNYQLKTKKIIPYIY